MSKISSNKSCSKLNFVQKSQLAHVSISPRSGALGGSKDCYFRNIRVYKNDETDLLKSRMLLKIRIMSKLRLNKSCSELNFILISWCICLLPPRVEPGGSKDCHFRYIKMYKNDKVDSLQAWVFTRTDKPLLNIVFTPD